MSTLTSYEIDIAPEVEAIFNAQGWSPNPGVQTALIACDKRFIGATGGIQSGKSESAKRKFFQKWIKDLSLWQPCSDSGGTPYLCKGHSLDISTRRGEMLQNQDFDWNRFVSERAERGIRTESLFRCDDTLRYWLVGKNYEQAEVEFHGIAEGFAEIGLPVHATARVDPGFIELRFPGEPRPRLRIDTKSEKDPAAAFSRVSPHGIIACEAGQLSLSTFHTLRLRVGGKNGWLFLIGTIERSQPWFPSTMSMWKNGWDDRQSFELPTYENISLYPQGRNDPEFIAMLRELPDHVVQERLYGQSAPPEGLVFKDVRADLHVDGSIKWNPDLPVHLWVDPGYGSDSAYAVEVAQIYDRRIEVIDEIFVQGLVTEEVCEIAMKRDWWKSDDKTLVGDPHYFFAHHSMQSVGEKWLEVTGLVSHKVDKFNPNDLDERLASFLKVDPVTNLPGITFSPRCEGVLSEFGLVTNPFTRQNVDAIGNDSGEIRPYKWRELQDGTQMGKEPVAKYNHGIRALEYGIVDRFGGGKSRQRRIARVTRR